MVIGCGTVHSNIMNSGSKAASRSMNYDIYTQIFKTVVDAAIDEEIYVIIDWHSHNAEDHLKEAKIFFQEMAQTYGEYDNIIYQINN